MAVIEARIANSTTAIPQSCCYIVYNAHAQCRTSDLNSGQNTHSSSSSSSSSSVSLVRNTQQIMSTSKSRVCCIQNCKSSRNADKLWRCIAILNLPTYSLVVPVASPCTQRSHGHPNHLDDPGWPRGYSDTDVSIKKADHCSSEYLQTCLEWIYRSCLQYTWQ